MSIMSNAKRALAIAAAAATLLSMAACGSSNAASGKSDSSGAASSGKIEVVASINQWGSVAEDLGGSNVEVTNIMTKTNVEAHDYEPTSQDVAKFGTAKVAVVNGADYDPWATKAAQPTKATLVTAAETAGIKEGDNPHVWFSAKVRSNTADAITAAGDAMTALGISFTQVTRDTNIIAQVLAGESTVTSVFTADQLNTITEFGQHMDFFGIDLTRVPQYSLAADNLPLLIFPILAVVTMFISTHISMKASGQQMQGSMKLTMYMMPLMYVFFCFTVPCAFSLYYVISNIVMTVQTQVMRKIYDPEKMKEQVKAEIASRKKEEKRGVKSTTIKVQDEKTGEVVEKNISASEMNKRRLEYARQQDAERYKDERTVPLSELQNKKED